MHWWLLCLCMCVCAFILFENIALQCRFLDVCSPVIFFFQDDVKMSNWRIKVRAAGMWWQQLQRVCSGAVTKNYRELADVKLPKEKKRKEKTPRSQILSMYWNVAWVGLLKFIYIGFSQDFDEWRDPDEWSGLVQVSCMLHVHVCVTSQTQCLTLHSLASMLQAC